MAIFETPEFRAMMEQLLWPKDGPQDLQLVCIAPTTQVLGLVDSKLNQSRVHMFVCFDLVMHGHK
jgi:hypothetical protein